MVTVNMFFGDRVCTDGGCEATVTGTARFRWIKLVDCVELLSGQSFLLWMIGIVWRSYVNPAVVYGCEE